ncbi:disulfide bond formation protein B [Amylibacter sp. IMCC11727]|uniref:disulfide bond formation protein B n=1 Tax=Amylibacter sp. IMCC11727 TaxID=3039851 RepID=UPI00244DFBD1|nr:disulfide bond formation protein B [Amylibacter sp. IMCC11727]WGI20293.1 disulfide bond formation protein B [Amylibacter sp. IMCC11727]
MTRQRFLLLAALGSALMLAGAFGFQYIGELPPCKMCIWQRWPHGVAVLIGLIGALVYHRGLALLGALAALTTAVIGLYHAGVEQDWWEGPSTCTSGSVADVPVKDLLKQILEAPIVRCDEIPWDLFGISMAGWNAIISFGLVALWLLAARR